MDLTKIPKSKTIECGERVIVLFDRRTIPKSGKSRIGKCFVKEQNTRWYVYDARTRALLGMCFIGDTKAVSRMEEMFEASIGESKT